LDKKNGKIIDFHPVSKLFCRFVSKLQFCPLLSSLSISEAFCGISFGKLPYF